jgi:uncharacterized membrane protein
MAALHQLIRFLHVTGMAVLLGGAAFTWNAMRAGDRSLAQLVQFEWVFWATMGVMVVTGVGNLGALGAPGPGTRWGTVLTGKLLVVLAFVLASAVRTFTVLEVRRRDRATAGPTVRRLYAGTAWTLLALVGFAEVLAHG